MANTYDFQVLIDPSEYDLDKWGAQGFHIVGVADGVVYLQRELDLWTADEVTEADETEDEQFDD